MADAYFNNAASTSIDNASNWWSDEGFSTPYEVDGSPAVPDFTNGSLTLQIGNNANAITCDKNISLDLSAHLIVTSQAVFNHNSNDFNLLGTIENNSGGTIYCYNSLNITSTGVLNNYGNLSFTAGILTNGGDINNHNTLATSNGHSIINNSVFNIYSGTLDAYGTISNAGTFNNNAGGTCNLNGAFTNSSGTVTNSSIMAINSTFTNNALITNSANLNINNTLVNNSTLSNSNLLAIEGTLTNNGTTTIATGGYLKLSTTSTFTNNGTFSFGNNYTTRFKGSIFPQVPSSAAFGTAILF
jgi:hypothetical protein